MNMKCPDCGSTLFHIRIVGKEIVISCWKNEKCGWRKKVVEKSE